MAKRVPTGLTRKFGLTMSGAFAVLGLLLSWRGQHWPAQGLVAAAGLFLVAGLARPDALERIYRVWMALGRVLGWINTRVILALLFHLLVTPLALAMRVASRDVLRRRSYRKEASYWRTRSSVADRKRKFEKMF